MGFLRKVSDSDIQGEKLRLVDPPVLMSIGATASPDSSRTSKKRKRKNTVLTTSARPAALNEISDDSDLSSSDDEKSPQEQVEHRLSIQKRRKHRRKVFFGDPSSTTRYYTSSISKEELRGLKRDLWFTKQDRLRTQAKCLEVLKAFRVQNAEDVTRFSVIYRTSMCFPFSQESSDFLEKATVSVPLTIRGMEWGIAPKLKKRRREHIRSVLALQESISDAELRSRFVSSRSVQSSRPARIMARMIGEGDAFSGKTSTALNVTTVPMALANKTKKNAADMLPLGEQQQNSSKATSSNANCGIPTQKTTKLGHARRRRKPVLWRK